MSHTYDQDKSLQELHDDTLSGLMWLRMRVGKLRAGFDDAGRQAERMAREVDILRDFLVQGELLDESDREKVETLHEHILSAYADLCMALEDGKGAGAFQRC